MDIILLALILVAIGLLWYVGCVFWAAHERGKYIDYIPQASADEFEEIMEFFDSVPLDKHVWLRFTFRNPFDGWEL